MIDTPRLKQLFLEAIEAFPTGPWDSHLAAVVPDDSELRRKLEQLLRAHAELVVRPNPSGTTLAAAIGAVVGELGNRLGGLPLAGILGEADIQLRGVLGGIAQNSEDEPAYGSDVFWDPMFLAIMVQVARRAGREMIDGTVAEKIVLSNADYDFSQLTDMEVTRVTLWLIRDQDRLVPLVMRVEGWEGVDRVLIERRWDGRAWVGPLSEAHRIVDLIQGLNGRTAEAVTIGLVNRVVPHERLLAEARGLARTIAGKPPLAVAACLASVTRGLNVSIDEGLQIEAMQFARLAGSRDVQEGIAAFKEKRQAVFRGA